MPLVTRLTLLSLFWQLSNPVFSVENKTDPVKFLNEEFSEIIKIAKEQEKFVFVDVFAEWCRPCKQMEKEVFTDLKVADFFNKNFLSLRIDADNDPLKSLEDHNITVLPTLLFFDPKGRMVFKKEGFVDADRLRSIGRSLTKLQAYHDDYLDKPGKIEFVWQYVNALSELENSRASGIAISYLQDLNERRYADSLNWLLIRDHVTPWNDRLFKNVLGMPELLEIYPDQYTNYLLQSFDKVLAFGIIDGNSAYLREYRNYVNKYSFLLDNPDSLVAAAELRFYSANRVEELPGKLQAYIENHEKQDASNLSKWAFELATDYYQKEILHLAEKYALKSNETEENFRAHLALSIVHDKLMDYRKSYAYLLLTYGFAQEKSQFEVLDEYKKELDFKLSKSFSDGVNFAGKSENQDDGRFTLGAGRNRLMYGYPVPKSTSHFIINIDGKLASNSPHLQSSGLSYLTGINQYLGNAATPEVLTVFNFDGVQIKQKLIPVDRNGVPVERGFAQYYKVSYVLNNLTKDGRTVGLGILFDTMIDDNDACRITADNIPVVAEYGFQKDQVPSQLLFYRSERDTSDMMGAAIIKGLQATPPDKLVIGRWPVLHGVTWKLSPQAVRYEDSAYFMKWENKRLEGRSSIEFITYYGLPAHKSPLLSILLEDDEYMIVKENIFFSHQQYGLDLNARMLIDKVVSNPNIRIMGILLNGYTDIKGGKNYNFSLSEKRIESVAQVLKAHNIPYIPKPHGLSASSTTAFDEKYGNAWDRKVELEIYYKPKGETKTLISEE